jgi:hypothetical protein
MSATQGGLLPNPSNRQVDSIDREIGMATTVSEGVE